MPKFTGECNTEGVFVFADELKIAKLGDDETWISLEPGWKVTGDVLWPRSSPKSIKVTYNGVQLN